MWFRDKADGRAGDGEDAGDAAERIAAPSDQDASEWGMAAAGVAADGDGLAADPRADELRAGGLQRLYMSVSDHVDGLAEASLTLRDRLRGRRPTARVVSERADDHDRARLTLAAHRDVGDRHDPWAMLPEIPDGSHWWLLAGIAAAEVALNWQALIELGDHLWVVRLLAVTTGFGVVLATYLVGRSLRRLLEPQLETAEAADGDGEARVGPAGGDRWRGPTITNAVVASAAGTMLVALTVALHVLRSAAFATFDVPAPSWTLWVVQLFFIITAIAATMLADSPHRRRRDDLERHVDETDEALADAEAADREAAYAVDQARHELYAIATRIVAYLAVLDEHTRRQLAKFADAAQQQAGKPVHIGHDGHLDEALRLAGWSKLAGADWQLQSPEAIAAEITEELRRLAGDDPAAPADGSPVDAAGWGEPMASPSDDPTTAARRNGHETAGEDGQ